MEANFSLNSFYFGISFHILCNRISNSQLHVMIDRDAFSPHGELWGTKEAL